MNRSGRRLTENCFGRMDVSTGELAVMHQFSDMAVEDLTNRRDLDEANPADPGLDPVISHPRHAEQAGRIVLCQAQLIAGADCGFASFSTTCEVHPTVVWAKLASLAEGTRLATKELWGRA
jgi:hypothetical protein